MINDLFMQCIILSDKIFLVKSDIAIKRFGPKGRGVVALRNFKKGELIEDCPTIVVNSRERKHCEKTILNYYIYPWRSTRTGSVVLGYGSIYNHSFEPNADWKQDFRSQSMTYRAIKEIKKGEEITINYNGEPDDMTPVDWLTEDHQA